MSRVNIAELRRLHEAVNRPDCTGTEYNYFTRNVLDALPALLDELESAREMTAYAETYGELVRIAPKVAGAIVGHEWDNMLPVEQKRWLLSELSAARETVLRLTQANADLRRERDRAVREAQRQDSVANGLRRQLDGFKPVGGDFIKAAKAIGAAEELERIAANWYEEMVAWTATDFEQRSAQLRQEAEGK